MKSSAVAFSDVGLVEIVSVDVPIPAPGEVQVRTRMSYISPGTEGWVLRNQFSWMPTSFPCIPGYQRVGTIEAVGAGVVGFELGQRVVATTSQGYASIAAQWGAHAALGNTVETEVFAVPDTVDDVNASAAVVAQVGYNAAARLFLDRGDWVVVYGDGIIGQCAAQAARARGARVLLVGHRSERLAIAKKYSADITVNNKERNLTDAVEGLIGKNATMAVIDTVQTRSARTEYSSLLQRSTGQIVYAGFNADDRWDEMGELQKKEFTTHFISGWTRNRIEKTIALMEGGSIDVGKLTTHIVRFDRAAEMYSMIELKNSHFLGVALKWGDVE